MFYACCCKFLLLFGLKASSHYVYSVASHMKVGARIRVDVCNIKVLQVCVGISCDFQKKEFSVALTYASMTEWLRWRI
jgi:hypothetical protein